MQYHDDQRVKTRMIIIS